MKTIGITMEIKGKLEDERKDSESFNDILQRLIENCDDIESYVPCERTNIKVSEDTLVKLRSLRQSSKESYGSVITRLINSKKLSTE